MAKKTIQAGINLTNHPDDQVWVEEGTYTENIALSAYDKVYGGFAGDEVTFEARDTETYYVVIEPLDPNLSVVTMSGNSTVLDGFTITNGGATQGSGISVDTGTSNTIAIDNCIIIGNNAIGGGSTGGGVYCTGSGTLNLADSSIVGNSALDGGGLSSDSACEIGFSNCVISGNVAGNSGGGLYLFDATAALENCIISGNLIGEGFGGAVFIESITTSYFYNCTISSNSVDPIGLGEAGGLFLGIDTTTNLINCILHDNTKTAIVEGDVTSSAILTNCLFYSNDDGDYYDFLDPGPSVTISNDASGLNALAGNAGNVVSDPKFVAGSTGSATAEYDIAGNYTTISDGSAAYSTDELAGLLINPVDSQHFQGLILSNTATNIIIQGDLKVLYTDVAPPLTRAASTEPETYNIIDYHIQNTSGARDVETNGGIASTDFDGEARPANGTTDIGADEYVDTNSDGEPDYIDDGDGLSDVDEAIWGSDPLDTDSDGDTLTDGAEVNEHGSNPTLKDTDSDGWDDDEEVAFGSNPDDDTDFPTIPIAYVDQGVGSSGDGTSWEEAFKTIQEGIDIGEEVWVKTGTYNETISFRSNVEVYGRFAGAESTFGERPTSGNVTTINATGPDFEAVEFSLDTNSILDGFTITASEAGYAGIYVEDTDASSTISNCIITGFSTNEGGAAVYLANSSIVLTGLTLINNAAISSANGGAIFLEESSPAITDCNIFGNTAADGGGGVFMTGNSDPIFTNCNISGNLAQNGGGVRVEAFSDPTFLRCTFSGNYSNNHGGGFSIVGGSNVTITNCFITGNEADNSGATVTNSTFASNNHATGGSAIYLVNDGDVTLVNNIFYYNTGVAIHEGDTTSDATMTNNMFDINDEGDQDFYDADDLLTYTGDTMDVNVTEEGNSDNFNGDTVFLPARSGSWTGVSSYDSASNTTVLTRDSASVADDALVGKILRVYNFSRFEAVVVANTDTTVTVAGDVSGLAVVGPPGYAFKDYHIRIDSDAIDAATTTGAPSDDIDGESRTAAQEDIGADEFVDTDSDGLSDHGETEYWGTDENDDDSDGDGLLDGEEIDDYETDPNDSDSDGDNLSDGDEINTHLTDPNEEDSDSDTYNDDVEIADGSDPNDNQSVPRIARAYVDAGVGSSGDGTTWGTAVKTIQEGIELGLEVWGKVGTYAESITLRSGGSVYGHFDGTETSFGQRSTVAGASSIGDNGVTSDIVVIDSTTNTVLDGFTISNSNSGYRGVYAVTLDSTNTISDCLSGFPIRRSSGTSWSWAMCRRREIFY